MGVLEIVTDDMFHIIGADQFIVRAFRKVEVEVMIRIEFLWRGVMDHICYLMRVTQNATLWYWQSVKIMPFQRDYEGFLLKSVNIK